ncbi:DUF3775 domain-containing protein [Mangrovicoccus algicola]|uniref:DUF3775 domain-containing protein n=1 Tax=Mangrovicoccus algicola TaxID=2771008 RepID=A0A8J6YW65_9RHOB|nr:DUF3775 domain-containing protein [Mangrovicoccus algicola]MBE3638995.1 DUF3775 domain-containing protein [Mangrovicoccus algicola]
MPEIHPDIVAQVILLAREAEDSGSSTARAELSAFIAGLTEDDALALVAIAWIGRESFAPEEWDEALSTARDEARSPTESYLAGLPQLAGYLEDGLEALGISAGEAEEDLM